MLKTQASVVDNDFNKLKQQPVFDSQGARVRIG